MQKLLLPLVVLASFYCSYSNAQTTGPNGSTRLNTPNSNTIADDRYVEVPLQFEFPFYGEDFDTSFMYDNGVIGFRDPAINGNAQRGGYGFFCCNPTDIQAQIQNGTTQNMDVYSFAIYGLWTDLVDLEVDIDGDGVVDSGYFTEGDVNFQRYYWQNIAEYHNATRLNSFDITIRPDGSYNINFGSVDIRGHGVASGVAGDLAGVTSSTTYDSSIHGEEHWLYNQGYRTAVTGALSAVNNYAQFCATNALYDPTCPGYATAYANHLFQQQCTADPLYDSTCSGYAVAYHNQQCTANPLYDVTCPGYQTAYYDQQCNADPFYDTGCPGYATAYYNQQCTLDPLYDSGCTGYAEAYYDEQCTLDPTYDTGCVGYDVAYYNQQCSYDPQYDEGCPGYIAPVEIVEETYEIEIPEVEIFTYEPEVVQMTGDESTMTDVATFVEDDIEVEIAQLEEIAEVQIEESIAVDGETIMEDDIERELEALQASAEEVEEEVREEIPAIDLGPDDVGAVDIVEKREDIPEPKANEGRQTGPSKKEKLKQLLITRAQQLSDKIDKAATIEEQMIVQRQLLALAAFVPDFDYDKEELPINLNDYYGNQPIVDHAYARWFLNDPSFGELENLQYPNLRSN